MNELHRGISKAFYYYLVLTQKKKNWIDEEVDEKMVLYTVKYDALKREYGVTEKIGETITESRTEHLDVVQQRVTKLDQIGVASANLLKQGKRYYVKVKCQMKPTSVPFHLDDLLFFVPLLEIDTPWAYSPSLPGF